MTTGPQLKEAREDAGLTQEQIAAKLGVHRVTIVTWESKATVKGAKAARYLAAVRELSAAA